MNVRDLVPWTRGREADRAAASSAVSPLLSLHRDMNRLFDDVFQDFGAPALWSGRAGWPSVEVQETDAEYKITAELPGLEEKDLEVLMQDGVLILRGEKRSETEDRSRTFSERVYGRFERRFVLEGVDEERLQASFRNGVLTVTAPKTERSRERVRRIPIGGRPA